MNINFNNDKITEYVSPNLIEYKFETPCSDNLKDQNNIEKLINFESLLKK
jgi:hypothetical protein